MRKELVDNIIELFVNKIKHYEQTLEVQEIILKVNHDTIEKEKVEELRHKLEFQKQMLREFVDENNKEK